jgi:hypothetical protein
MVNVELEDHFNLVLELHMCYHEHHKDSFYGTVKNQWSKAFKIIMLQRDLTDYLFYFFFFFNPNQFETSGGNPM